MKTIFLADVMIHPLYPFYSTRKIARLVENRSSRTRKSLDCCISTFVVEESGRWLQVAGDNPWSRPYQLALNPADPSKLGDGPLNLAFESNRRPQQPRVACSIHTWEKKCKENGKDYALSQDEQDKGTAFLRCDHCGNHLCNLCTNLFCRKIESITKAAGIDCPAWCITMKKFLKVAEERNILLCVFHCASCVSTKIA
jgi:hypothetical protein